MYMHTLWWSVWPELQQLARKQEHGSTTWWECDKCGQEWSREWDDTLEGEDVGWCYEGPHHDSESDTSD